MPNENIRDLAERLIKVETTVELSFKNLTEEIKFLTKAIDKLASNQEKFDGAIVTIANLNNRVNKLDDSVKKLQNKFYYASGALAVIVFLLNFIVPTFFK